MLFTNSNLAFKTASQFLVGGVNSPARNFQAVNRFPVFIKRGIGSKTYDLDGNKFIDYVCSWGAIILGHAHKQIIHQVEKALKLGSSFGAPTQLETTMARLVKKFFPFIEKIRMVNSGTEATLSAIRLARGFTRRDKIIKFRGCYHGHADSFLIAAGSGALTLNRPNSLGITHNVVQDTILAEYNDFHEIEKIFKKNKKGLAAVIIEPIAGNMGLIKSDRKFLKSLREITKQNGTLLIFDEVMTGFRVARGGASELYDITPDLVCLGKVIGGGFPVGALGGKGEVMDHLAPTGPVYQAGTLSGNPIAMTAGIGVLNFILKNKNFYSQLEKKGRYLEENINFLIESSKLKITISRVGSMFTLFFRDKSVTNYLEAQKCDLAQFSFFFNYLLNLGSYFPPSQFESGFLNNSHSYKDLDATLNHLEPTFKKMQKLK